MSTRVAIIGGGIAGPVTALALHRIGVEATVYEAYEHDARTAGSFLSVASNGLAALELLDAHRGVLAAGFPTPRFAVWSGRGRRLGEMTSSTTVPGRPDPVTLRRADLYLALLQEVQAAGVGVEYGKRLDTVDELGDGVRAWFTDGSNVTADLLVGADGLHSTTRTIIDPAAQQPRYLGLLGTGGYTDRVELDSPPGTFHFVFGARAFFGYTVPEPGRVWWFANLPLRLDPSNAELGRLHGQALRGVLLDAFADDRVPASTVIAATDELTPALPVHDLAPVASWHRERLVLVGDAAHATSPSSGQGASLAVEDAVILAQCLRDLPDHQAAFTRYQQLRRPRTQKVFDDATRINNNKAAGPIARRIRDAVLPLVFRFTDPSKAKAEEQDYTIDWNRTLRPDPAHR